MNSEILVGLQSGLGVKDVLARLESLELVRGCVKILSGSKG